MDACMQYNLYVCMIPLTVFYYLAIFLVICMTKWYDLNSALYTS